MKKSGLLLLLCCLLSAVFIGCHEDSEPERKDTAPAYKYSQLGFCTSDTTFSSAEQTVYLTLYGTTQFHPIIMVYDEKCEPIPFSERYLPGVISTTYFTIDKNASVSEGEHDSDWIDTEIVDRDGFCSLKLTLKENKSEKELRSARIMVEYASDESLEFTGNSLMYGIIDITQWSSVDPVRDINFRYKDKLFSTECRLSWDDKCVYSNPEVTSLIDNLAHSKEIDYVVEGDEIRIIDENDTEGKMFVKALMSGIPDDCPYPTRSESGSFEKTSPYPANLYLYCLDSFFDEYFSMIFFLDDLKDTRHFRQLSDVIMNDRITSLVVDYRLADEKMCSVLRLWEDKNYNKGGKDKSKQSITFVASCRHPVTKCETLRVIPYIGTDRSWNNRASSFSFEFGKYNK